MTNPFVGGGKVKYVPGRVKTPLETDIPQKDEQAVLNAALERDLAIADLLEADKQLDMLDAAIDEQMQGMDLPGNEAEDAARSLCGSKNIDWDCYKKAKEMLRIAPWIANGFDPVQTVFGNGSTPRSGKVIFNCKDFDPNTFFETSSVNSGSNNGDTGLGEGQGKESFGEIQKRAQENQKNWALRILFWEFIWGRPEVKESFLEEQEATEESFETLINKVDQLKKDGKTKEAEKLSALLSFNKLPDTIREGRPLQRQHLRWEAYPITNGPLDHVTRNGEFEDTEMNPNASAIYVDPWSLIKDHYKYKDLGIPAIKIGFLLSLLIGALGLFPKVLINILRIKTSVENKFKIIRRIPVVGKSVFNSWKKVAGIIFVPWVYINNIFINIIIWLSMKPAGYKIDLGDIPEEYSDINIPSDIDDKVATGMDVKETPAGFIPMDCLANAQQIVNRVHQHASE